MRAGVALAPESAVGIVEGGAALQRARRPCSLRWRTRNPRLIPALHPGRTSGGPPWGPPSASRTWPIPPPPKRRARMPMVRIGARRRQGSRIGHLPRSVHPYRRRPVQRCRPPPQCLFRPRHPHRFAGHPRQARHPCRYRSPRTWRSRRPRRCPCRLPRSRSECPRSCRLWSIRLLKTIRGSPPGFRRLGTPPRRVTRPLRWRPGRVRRRPSGIGGTMPCSLRTCPGTFVVPGSG